MVRSSDKPFYRLYGKLRNLKRELKALNSECYSDIQNRVKSKASEVSFLLMEMYEDPSAANIERVHASKMELDELRRSEEEIMRLKDRALWVENGDINTSFFFKSVKARQACNTIRLIYNEQGDKVDKHDDIAGVLESFYKKLLGEKSSSCLDGLESVIRLKVSDDQAELLERPVTAKEVKASLDSMPNEKSHGPNGFSVAFYKRCWSLVGQDVIDAVLSFFSSGKIPSFVNSVYLALIPKKVNAAYAKDFRPISCCNVIYKIISKVIAMRLRDVLPDVIDKPQSSFIKGRLISDNVLLAHELLRTYSMQTFSLDVL
ncbi:Transposon TX1 uncharacterized 149 kDa protein [Linum perenne]